MCFNDCFRLCNYQYMNTNLKKHMSAFIAWISRLTLCLSGKGEYYEGNHKTRITFLLNAPHIMLTLRSTSPYLQITYSYIYVINENE